MALENKQRKIKAIRTENKKKQVSNYNLGEFDINDFPENRNEEFYFYEYDIPDGEWVNIDETICKIRIGEKGILQFSTVVIRAKKAGVLEWTSEKDDSLKNGDNIYKLHQKGEYQNENSIENFEHKDFFKEQGFKHSFNKWLVDDGSLVKEGEPIFEYNDSKYKKHINYSKKNGFIHQIDPNKILDLNRNELMYVIRDTDEKRIEQRFINKPNLITDDFTELKIVKWHRVSSSSEISPGVKTKSDNMIIDFLFTFNYLDDNDYIVFHFNSKQIRPKQFDKINFLFENGEQIQFELLVNPTFSKNRLNEKILEYKGLITKSELNLFASTYFKKWKISLVSDKREILGGDKSGDAFYSTKNNIRIVIKKFANDYINLVQKTIPNYQPTEFKKEESIKETAIEFCYVYLMHDTSNKYYKIGISNKPEYRERTLQSEKPTIEMIQCKKFPVRKIAESIEKALHQTYSDKRLRGEWFELSKEDIEHIKQTLS
ncbi:GIY-YIG nuclease family protein [Zobellia russellii]|uniref:GIY-YIG nuclease family protein n=1 Tax=Zobellia russellii TaxID=248907 RepID=UPI001BFFD192|nr:GIY-YIG nuclease family protein [Zobellia russellii]MBT9187441.1 GIY-YIG nuclease family protein [Zobellia russellii]